MPTYFKQPQGNAFWTDEHPSYSNRRRRATVEHFDSDSIFAPLTTTFNWLAAALVLIIILLFIIVIKL